MKLIRILNCTILMCIIGLSCQIVSQARKPQVQKKAAPRKPSAKKAKPAKKAPNKNKQKRQKVRHIKKIKAKVGKQAKKNAKKAQKAKQQARGKLKQRSKATKPAAKKPVVTPVASGTVNQPIVAQTPVVVTPDTANAVRQAVVTEAAAKITQLSSNVVGTAAGIAENPTATPAAVDALVGVAVSAEKLAEAGNRLATGESSPETKPETPPDVQKDINDLKQKLDVAQQVVENPVDKEKIEKEKQAVGESSGILSSIWSGLTGFVKSVQKNVQEDKTALLSGVAVGAADIASEAKKKLGSAIGQTPVSEEDRQREINSEKLKQLMSRAETAAKSQTYDANQEAELSALTNKGRDSFNNWEDFAKAGELLKQLQALKSVQSVPSMPAPSVSAQPASIGAQTPLVPSSDEININKYNLDVYSADARKYMKEERVPHESFFNEFEKTLEFVKKHSPEYNVLIHEKALKDLKNRAEAIAKQREQNSRKLNRANAEAHTLLAQNKYTDETIAQLTELTGLPDTVFKDTDKPARTEAGNNLERLQALKDKELKEKQRASKLTEKQKKIRGIGGSNR